MKNDKGKWVQIVSLIRWKGFFFPYPTFGGVMVIERGTHDFSDYLERVFIGKGTYISPEEMSAYPYLTRQNTLSETVSRLQAESLKFLGGFNDPLPWNMKTAVKIPDLPDDQNQQPFVTDFDFTESPQKRITDSTIGLDLNLLAKKEPVWLTVFLFLLTEPTNFFTTTTQLRNKGTQVFLLCH